ncbi:hypothetical protein [Flavobacterium beibuense]|uniref:Uncharacterized protein n=1 Tax=Flavobacterium beibuense TaxID=657326 RepID=A0A444WFE3_9FLAO|nr:hypothetical protein [Flavobacterium beibuense]RYJ44547.1 hypothetical protein NU09_1157 [Flavobacterium beibuense]
MVTLSFNGDISITGDITLNAERNTSWSNKVTLSVKKSGNIIFKSEHPVSGKSEIIFQDLDKELTLIGKELFFDSDNLYSQHYRGYFFTGRLCTVFYNNEPIANVSVNRFICSKLTIVFNTDVTPEIKLYTVILLLMRYCRLDAD